MIRAFTSSYGLDLSMAIRLNKQLAKHGIDHHVFVEERDIAAFAPYFASREWEGSYLHKKPDGGEGGLGRSGALCRRHIHQTMLEFVKDGDTAVNLDSDVHFLNEKMIADITCAPGETRGFTGNEKDVPSLPLNGGGSFFHMSGMIIAAHADVYRRAQIGLTHEDVWGICQHLMDSGHGCSEDVVASYLYQYKADGKAIALQDRGWIRSIRGPCWSRIYPDPAAGYPTEGVDVIA